MSDGLSCDRCGKTLLVNEEVRYVVEMKIYAAYDVLEVTKEDLARDHQAEIRKLLAEIEGRPASAAEDEVARELRFDLCPACQRHLLKDPLGRGL